MIQIVLQPVSCHHEMLISGEANSLIHGLNVKIVEGIEGIQILDLDQASKNERIQRIQDGKLHLESEVRGDSVITRAVWSY